MTAFMKICMYHESSTKIFPLKHKDLFFLGIDHDSSNIRGVI